MRTQNSDTLSGNALVIGMGSIGERHHGVLSQMGLDVFSVSRHKDEGERNFRDLRSALKTVVPDYVVVANPTGNHIDTLIELREFGFEKPIMVEKPLLARSDDRMPEFLSDQLSVGYQLRFHPAILELKKSLADEKIISVNSYVGQNLRGWRKNRPYQDSYSTKKDLGGGVLRDLSHELDLILWLFGDWKKVVAQCGQWSDLDLDCEDVTTVLLSTEKSPSVTVEMNYVDHCVQRKITVNCDKNSYVVDLIGASIQVNEKKIEFSVSRNDLFVAAHEAALERNFEILCTEMQGIGVLELIEAIESSSREGRWVCRR